MEEIALALRGLNPLQLSPLAERKHGDYLQSYAYR